MVKYQTTTLDSAFGALADPTRRAMLTRLSRGGSATISELAQPHSMSLPAASKHVRVLEDAGLLARERDGRSFRCRLVSAPLVDAAHWLRWLESFWGGQLDGLENYIRELEAAEAKNAKKNLDNKRSKI